ncbi:MAG: ZIP family metal transporter, partial [Planctomycetota bacterium]
MDWFVRQSPVVQALLAGLFTWGITALGAALVVFARRANRRLLDAMLGFSGGVMIAASYWSLLAPSIEIAEARGDTAWLAPAVGFLV